LNRSPNIEKMVTTEPPIKKRRRISTVSPFKSLPSDLR
jgi:hypothetical protein